MTRHLFLMFTLLLLPVAGADETPPVVTAPVTRGDIGLTLTERGELDAVRSTEVLCQVRAAGRGANFASTIRWVVEDGTLVKQGDVLLRLDDSACHDQIKSQQVIVQEKQALVQHAEKHRELTLKEVEHEVRTAEENVELAKLELAQAGTATAIEQHKRKVRLGQAERLLELARLQGAMKREQAQASLLTPKTVLATEQEKLKALLDDLEHCTIRAPSDGLVVYHVPEASRFGQQSPGLLAVGENVKEGQKLFRLPDLSRMGVRVKVHEAQVPRLRPGQAAQVRLDAQGQPLIGKVQQIAQTPVKTDWLSSDVNVYPVLIALEGDNRDGRLKPGMSVDVSILLAERRNVLRVPITAVVAQGRQAFCFVKKGDKHERRRVTLGLDNYKHVEILEGVQEGEEVVLNPRALRTRAVQAGPAPSYLAINSVRPSQESTPRRAFIAKYGLTATDLERLRTIPGVTGVVPVRFLPGALQRLGSPLGTTGRIVATTPEYARLVRLDEQVHAGRLLNDLDEHNAHNVAVLGADVAAALFPLDDPLGQTVQLGGKDRTFVIIGVLSPQATAPERDKDVYIPFSTSNVRLGAITFSRTGNQRSAEQVEVHQALLLAQREQLPGIASVAREQLERFRPAKDWEIGATK